MLLRFAEDEVAQGRSSPSAPLSDTVWEPQHDRLSVGNRERGETFMDFGLSNRPSLVLAVEGETECFVFERVLALAGYDETSPEIAVVNLKGVGGDVQLLARSVAVPHLDLDGFRGARLLSPLTALIVVVDPEKDYETSDRRTDVRDSMIDDVMSSMPATIRSDAMRRDLEHLIHVRSRPEEFEFSHWSDVEIANALQEISSDAVAMPCDEICKRVKRHRQQRSNLRNIWSNWRSKPSKVKLVEQLWPVLDERIQSSEDPESIPIVKIVQDAIGILHRIGPVRELAPRDGP